MLLIIHAIQQFEKCNKCIVDMKKWIFFNYILPMRMLVKFNLNKIPRSYQSIELNFAGLHSFSYLRELFSRIKTMEA